VLIVNHHADPRSKACARYPSNICPRWVVSQDVNVLPHLVQHMRRTDCTILSIVASHHKSSQTTRSLRSPSKQTIGIYGRRSGNLRNVQPVVVLRSSHHTSVTRNLFCVCSFSGARCRIHVCLRSDFGLIIERLLQTGTSASLTSPTQWLWSVHHRCDSR